MVAGGSDGFDEVDTDGHIIGQADAGISDKGNEWLLSSFPPTRRSLDACIRQRDSRYSTKSMIFTMLCLLGAPLSWPQRKNN